MQRSEHLFKQASAVIPGGVNSPVRAFRSVGGTPVFIKHADGAYLYDVDDQRYIDYVGSWGPMLIGHNHPAVRDAVLAAVQHGLSYGAPTEAEVTMAQTLCKLVPSMEQVRMVNSGTEATMSAIRLARGYTGRDKFLKFEGCYHGHADSLLVKAGSGALTLGEPNSPGIPADVAHHTLTASYNDLAGTADIFAEYGSELAAVIVEPVAGNMNCIPPEPGFLEGLRQLCNDYGALLIFDEVMTGFRVALGGAQEYYGITPDLTTLGKVIGGGMPVGAFGGKAEIMQAIAPTGPVYQAGTLSGNPVAMAAGLAMLDQLQQPGVYQKLEDNARQLTEGLVQRAQAANVPLTATYRGGMFGYFFTSAPAVRGFADATACDSEAFRIFFHSMLDSGIYLAPSTFEAGFISTAHTAADIEATLAAAEQAFAKIANR